MSDTNDLIAALLKIGANFTKNEDGELVARFLGSVSTQLDENKEEHLCVGGSSVNLTNYKHKIAKSEIILSPI